MKAPQSKDEQFERIWSIRPAYDKRHSVPSKNYGIHGCDLRMVLKGPLGATQFVLFTNWHLPHVQDELDAKIDSRFPHLSCHPNPADRGYHWRTPRYEGQGSQENCEYCDGAPCYYDGSSLNAEELYKTLLLEGSEGVWRELEALYHELSGRDSE